MFNEHAGSNISNVPDEPKETDTSNQNENAEHNDSSDETETTAQQRSGFALDTCLQPPDLGQQLLSYDDGIYCIAPAERNRPESILKIPKMESMAFPVQFPDGKNTFDEPDRCPSVSPSRYFNSRLFSVDNRCACDTNYIFFAQFVTEMHQATSSMSIQLRKVKPTTCDGRRINCSLLQDKHELQMLVQNKEATMFIGSMAQLRMHGLHWHQQMN
ncbi:uncharacterized protein LOC113071434 [Tachysurus ichikawai]